MNRRLSAIDRRLTIGGLVFAHLAVSATLWISIIDDIEHSWAFFFFILLIQQVGLLAMWLAIGASTLPRIGVALAAIAWAAWLGYTPWHSTEFVQAGILLLSVSILYLLTWMRWGGWRLVWYADVSQMPPTAPFQFSIKRLVGWTLAIVLALALGQPFVEVISPRPLDRLNFALLVVSYSASQWLGIWAVLAARRARSRVAVVTALVVVLAILWQYLASHPFRFGGEPIVAISWTVVFYLFPMANLLIIRFAGYRYVWNPSRGGVSV